MVANAPEQAIKKTVQDFEPKDSLGASGDYFWMYFPQRESILSSWGHRSRDRQLREYYRDPHNGLVQGAFAGLVKRVASTPYVISHATKDKGSRKIAYYQELLNNAQFGDYGGGWRGFVLRLLLDFLTQDFGGVCEIIGAGSPSGALTGPVQGVAHLDALRCEATGNPEYPIVYWSRRTNKLHRLHHTRVARFVDMPDGDEWAKGKGLSALSRMISIVKQQLLISKYNIERLDDLPPAGFLVLNNVLESKWKDIQREYQFDRESAGQTTWSNLLVLTAMDPAQKVEVGFTPFATVPEHFSYREYTEMHVNAIALTLGVDPQDIWPLTGAPLGTGQQSQILNSKARGKMFGDILTMLERFINWYILPPDMEFEFRYQDDEQNKVNAEIAQLQAGVANSLIAVLGNTTQARELAVKYLAETVESFRNILIDASGDLIKLADDDPKADNEVEAETPTVEAPTADSETPVTTQGTTTTTASGSDAAPVERKSTPVGLRDTTAGIKDLQATRLDFEGDIEDLLNAAQSDDVTRRRFGTVLRGLIRRYGQRAYEDGLKAGGVDAPPDSDDLSTIAGLLAEQSGYVTNLGGVLFSEGGDERSVEHKPTLWWNKSINPFYEAGLMSADKNGMYTWVYGDTEHCADCKRLNGQVHRLKEWVKSGWKPQADKLSCKGFNCKCRWQKVKGSARGNY